MRLAQWYMFLGKRLSGKYLSTADTWIFLIRALSFYVASIIDYAPTIQWPYMFFAALGLVIGYHYTRRLFSKHQEYLIDREDVKTFKELSSIKGNRVTAVPKEFTYAVSYFSEKEYSTKLEIDFDSRAIDLADIIVVNKLTEEALPRKLEDKGIFS